MRPCGARSSAATVTDFDDLALARQLARESGALLLDLQRNSGLVGEALGNEGDLRADALILETLRNLRPDDAVLSEESEDDLARLSHDRVWIVDPLDGTREFRDRRDDWAVHIGLAVRGIATLGAVAIPARGECFASGDAPIAPTPRERLRLVTSRTRECREAKAVASALNAELVTMGSAGAKAMAVMRGEADLYVHAGGQHEWDNCAPVAVALAAGLHASRIDGAPFRYNNRDTLVPDLLICRPQLAERALAALATV